MINLNILINPAHINPGPAINFPIPPNKPWINLLPFSGSKAFVKASDTELKMFKRFFTAGLATRPPKLAANSFTLAIDLFIKALNVLSSAAFLRDASSVALDDCSTALP